MATTSTFSYLKEHHVFFTDFFNLQMTNGYQWSPITFTSKYIPKGKHQTLGEICFLTSNFQHSIVVLDISTSCLPYHPIYNVIALGILSGLVAVIFKTSILFVTSRSCDVGSHYYGKFMFLMKHYVFLRNYHWFRLEANKIA